MDTRSIMIGGALWGELTVSSKECAYVFYPENIPTECGGGQKDRGAVKGVIVCENEADARRCEQALLALILNGYCEPLNWLVALDMADLLGDVFNGATLNYWHMELDSSNVDEAEKRLTATSDAAATVFHYTAIDESEDDLARKISGRGSGKAANDAVAIFWQVSHHKEKKEDPATLDVWYR